MDVAVRQENHKLYNGRTTVVRQVRNSWATDPFHPLLERARQALAGAECPAQPGKWKLGRLGQGTAGGVLVEDYGIPTIGYGPGDEELAHAPDESVDVERLRSAVYGTAVIAQCLVGVPVFGWSADEI